MKRNSKLFRKNIKRALVPPLWLWLRFTLYISIAILFYFFGYKFITKTILILSAMSLLGPTLAMICKSLADYLSGKHAKSKAEKKAEEKLSIIENRNEILKKKINDNRKYFIKKSENLKKIINDERKNYIDKNEKK